VIKLSVLMSAGLKMRLNSFSAKTHQAKQLLGWLLDGNDVTHQQ